MSERERISLERIIDLIGDKVGEQYDWFLIGLEAQGIIDDQLTIDDIREIIYDKNLGGYEVSWDFVKNISKKLYAVVAFDLVGMKSKKDYEKSRLEIKENDWTDFSCEFRLDIYDGEIWEIKGNDVFLVNRMKKVFSTLPVLLW